VGVHGIWIHFEAPDGNEYSATYLPEVAAEQGWDQPAAIASLVRKAGYHRALPTRYLGMMRVTRYQSSKATLTYDEWRARAVVGGVAAAASTRLMTAAGVGGSGDASAGGSRLRSRL
jgi:hypothetical protein